MIAIYSTLFILAIACQAGCKSPSQKDGSNSSALETTPLPKKPPSSFQDTLMIEKKSVVFYYPDSIQLEQFRAHIDSGAFSSIMHEYEYLEKNARNFLDQYFHDIPVLQAKHVRYLIFRKTTKDSCIDLDRVGEPVGLYLFMPTKDPRLADLPNVDRELPAYFSGN